MTVPDAIFDHARLAPLYDAFDDGRGDLEHYLAITDEFGATSVLDVGCGTGSLAVLLTARGISVVGVDPAAASLDVARGKPGADGVRWIHGDATTLPPLHVDLALMTGNVAQVFLDDDDWLATLAGIRQALRPAGQLVFEVRRPERRAWQEWGGNGPVIKDLPGVGRVEQTFELTRVDLPFVSFRSDYTFASDGARITSESTLCFRTRDQIESDLDRTGFDLREVRDAPDRPGLEYVFIAVRR